MNALVTQNPEERILRQQSVQQLCGLSRTTIWRLERQNLFPARRRLGRRSVGWLASEVAAWIDKRAEAFVRPSNPDGATR